MIQKHDMYPLRLLVQLLAHQKLYSTVQIGEQWCAKMWSQSRKSILSLQCTTKISRHFVFDSIYRGDTRPRMSRFCLSALNGNLNIYCHQTLGETAWTHRTIIWPF